MPLSDPTVEGVRDDERLVSTRAARVPDHPGR